MSTLISKHVALATAALTLVHTPLLAQTAPPPTVTTHAGIIPVLGAAPIFVLGAMAKMQSFQVGIGALDKDVPIDGLFETSFYLKAIGGAP